MSALTQSHFLYQYADAFLTFTSSDISLDHLSRVLVDVHQDSSSIMNDLLSQYQRNLLDMIFMGDVAQRNKFNCIVAEQIKPKLPADGYMDKGDNENELKQIIGDIRACFDLGANDVILMGRTFLLREMMHVSCVGVKTETVNRKLIW